MRAAKALEFPILLVPAVEATFTLSAQEAAWFPHDKTECTNPACSIFLSWTETETSNFLG